MGLAARHPTAAPRHLRVLEETVDPRIDGRGDPVDVEVVVPVYNEAAQLEQRIRTLHTYLRSSFPFTTLITIVDNGSRDGTAVVAAQLATTLPGVTAISLDRKGRGHALRTAWSASSARVVSYMDVDLSTSLSALLPLVAPLLSGHGQVSIGTRLAPGSRVLRGPKRELISRTYNVLLRLVLRTHVSDAQCGFKALDRVSAQALLPLVADDEWFFDTELLITAERLGLRISEVPVDWVDDPDSRVHIASTVAADLRGMWRMAGRRSRQQARQRGPTAPRTTGPATADQVFSFAGIGLLSTLSYLFLFAAGRDLIGALGANAFALAVCTVVNTSVHRAMADRTDHPPGRTGQPRFWVAVTGLFAISALMTSLGLLVAGLLGASLSTQLVAVTAANAVAALLRFWILRAWVFRTEGGSPDCWTPAAR